MPYANILDTILDTPNTPNYDSHLAFEKAAALGDAFLDTDTRANARPKDRTAAVKDEVSEAVGKVASTQAPTIVKFASVDQAIKFGNTIAKYAAKFPDLKPAADAAARLNRIAAKSPAQMALDGATKLADYANPKVVPTWAKQVRADIALLHDVRNKFRMAGAVKKAKSAASLQVFDKSYATDHTKALTDASGDSTYLEPSAFMSDDDTHVPGTRMTPSHIATKETPRIVANPLKAKVAAPTRNFTGVILRSPGSANDMAQNGKTASVKKVAFTPAVITKLTAAGHPLDKIWQAGVKVAGAVEAKIAMQKFLKGLKKTNTKIALTQIDCTLLKGKLATSNPIVGESKCATCTYRKGMHCGYTGGTLITFPGIETTQPQHRIASGAPKDGHGMLNEFEMNKKADFNIEFYPVSKEADADFFAGPQGTDI